MQLGIAFFGSHSELQNISVVLEQLQRHRICPNCYAVSGQLFPPLLVGIFSPQFSSVHENSSLKRKLRRFSISSLEDLNLPIVICQKELLENRAYYAATSPISVPEISFPRTLGRYPIEPFLERFSREKTYRFRKHLFSGGHLTVQEIMMGLNLLNADRQILIQFCSSLPKQEFERINAHAVLLNISLSQGYSEKIQIRQSLDRNILNFYEFLYF